MLARDNTPESTVLEATSWSRILAITYAQPTAAHGDLKLHLIAIASCTFVQTN